MKILLLFVAAILLVNGALSEDDKYYFSYPLKTNWFKAAEACKYYNMELVSVLTPDSLSDVQSFMDDLPINTRFDDWANSIWTSGNDLGDEGQYTCASTGKHISTEMLKNEHITHTNHGVCMTEQCLTLVRKQGNTFIFNDDLCSRLRYFLCEARKPDHNTPRISTIENDYKKLLSYGPKSGQPEVSADSLVEVSDNKPEDGLENGPRGMPRIFYRRSFAY